MRYLVALAAFALLGLAAWVSWGGSGDGAFGPGRYGSVGIHIRGVYPRIDLPLLAALENRRVVERETGNEADTEEVEIASTVLAVAEPFGSRYPTENDVQRATWAVGHFDGRMDWAIVPLLEVEWCESGRRTTVVGDEQEVGPFQFKWGTWQRFTTLWFELRSDPPPVSPLNPWDAILMTAFAWEQGQTHEWSCYGRW